MIKQEDNESFGRYLVSMIIYWGFFLVMYSLTSIWMNSIWVTKKFHLLFRHLFHFPPVPPFCTEFRFEWYFSGTKQSLKSRPIVCHFGLAGIKFYKKAKFGAPFSNFENFIKSPTRYFMSKSLNVHNYQIISSSMNCFTFKIFSQTT